MFEFWKVWKRNPVLYYPRMVGTVCLTYFAVSLCKKYTSDWLTNNFVRNKLNANN